MWWGGGEHGTEFAFLTTPHPGDAHTACSSTILGVALMWPVI